ncbi:Mlp family lipoprotein (plasmid) [Borrelia sp. CA_690]|uniref:Mlp family lipoprotein n=1 Tax=Borrelia maritima TaxID=2761123 RepID=A0A5J6WCB0_9SPIR|nr:MULTISPECIES: Mlp family lipoprotein [Borrelia]QFI14986.1 Mlp family lipoprotein [Borrelia maritima]WKC83983.1 Mlp family lipoprotein [Borrelia sp. CA_690]
MRKIRILSMLLLVFSCKQFGGVKSLTEIDSGDGNSIVVVGNTVKDPIIKEISLTEQEAKKLETLKSFLKDAMDSNGKKEEDLKAEYEKSYREFFDWLSKDVNKQKELLNSFDNVSEILTKAVDVSKKQRPTEQQSLGLEEYITHKIKNSTGGYLSLFFQKVADAFGTEEYKKGDDESVQKPVKCNEEIFKVIKRVFTESDSNKELKSLKNCENNNI